MRVTEGYQGVMETVYVFTLERSLERKDLNLVQRHLLSKWSQHACSKSSRLRGLGALCDRAPVVGRENSAGYGRWWWLTVMVTAVKRETGVSGTFLQLNLKDLEHSLGTGRLSGIVKRQLLMTGDTVSSLAAGINWASFYPFAMDVRWLLFFFNFPLLIFLLLLPLTVECLFIYFLFKLLRGKNFIAATDHFLSGGSFCTRLPHSTQPACRHSCSWGRSLLPWPISWRMIGDRVSHGTTWWTVVQEPPRAALLSWPVSPNTFRRSLWASQVF